MLNKPAPQLPILKANKPSTRGRGRPIVDESKKLSHKFLATFTEKEFAPIRDFMKEEKIRDHSDAIRRLVRLGTIAVRLMKAGKINYNDLYA